VSIFLPTSDAEKYRNRPSSTPAVQPSVFDRPRGDAYDPYTGEPLNDDEQEVSRNFRQQPYMPPQPVEPTGPVAPEQGSFLGRAAGRLAMGARGAYQTQVEPFIEGAQRIGAGVRGVNQNMPSLSAFPGGMGAGLGSVEQAGRAGAEAFADPYSNLAIDDPLIQNLPDEGLQFGPLNLTPKTVAAFGYEALSDPLTYIGAPVAKKVGVPAVKKAAGAVNALDDAATLAARSGPPESSTSGILRGIDGSPGAVERATDVPFRPRISGGAEVPTQVASVSEELYGLVPAQPESPNGFIRALDNLKRATRIGVPSDDIATPIMRERDRARLAAESLSTRIGEIAEDVTGAFQRDKAGRVLTVPGTPTLQDIAADFPRYAPSLTPDQVAAMNRLRAEVEPIGRAITEQGIEFGLRADVKPGGFYLPRGNAAVEGWDAPLKVRSGGAGAGKPGYRKPAEFPTQADGIAKGYEYTSFSEAMQGYARQGANDTVDAWAANQFRATGLGEAGAGFRDKGVIGLPGMQGTSFPDEIVNVANKILNAEKPLSGKLSSIIATKEAIDAMARTAMSTLDLSGMGLQGLLGLALDPRAYGTAIKVSMKSIVNRRAYGAYLRQFDARAVANGTPTSRDLAKAGQRIGGSITEFTGEGIPQRVERVLESAIPLTDRVVEGGLNPLRGARRQFGALGDVLRNELSDTAFQIARARGDDGWSQLPEIVTSSNKMTGWTKRRLGGDLGAFANYAPRWMEANIETLADAARGALPGANIGQQQSRNAILRLIGAGTLLTFAANEALGEETDTRLIVNGRDNPNFMRIRGAGYDISVFGFYDRLIHLMAKAATGDGEGVARSLANAPSISTAWDLISGESVVGEPTRDNWTQAAQTVGSRAVPMSSGEYLKAVEAAREGDPARAAAAAVVGATGLRGSELSTTDRVRLGEYDQLTPEEQLRARAAQTWWAMENSPQMPPEAKQVFQRYGNVGAWKRDAIDEYRQFFLDRGLSPSNADYAARQAVDKHPLSRLYADLNNFYESQWIAANPQLAEQVLQEDAGKPRQRIAPRKSDRGVIQAGQ
jgi:hypothetical protein